MLFPTRTICLTNNSSRKAPRKANNRAQQIQPSPYCHTSEKATEQSRASQSLPDSWGHDWSVLSSKLQPASDFRYQRVQEEAQEVWGPFPERVDGNWKGYHGEDPRGHGSLGTGQSCRASQSHTVSLAGLSAWHAQTHLSVFLLPLLDTRNRARNSTEIKGRGSGCKRAARCAAASGPWPALCLAFLKFTSILQPSLCIPAAQVLGST